MYLKSLKITNFRKFGDENNVIKLVSQKDGLTSDDINVAKATTLVVGKNNSGKTTITEALEKLTENKSFTSNDCNFLYLNELLKNINLIILKSFRSLNSRWKLELKKVTMKQI